MRVLKIMSVVVLLGVLAPAASAQLNFNWVLIDGTGVTSTSNAELHADGTFSLRAEEPRSGTYEIASGTVTLRLDNGLAERATLAEDGTLTTREGRVTRETCEATRSAEMIRLLITKVESVRMMYFDTEGIGVSSMTSATSPITTT